MVTRLTPSTDVLLQIDGPIVSFSFDSITDFTLSAAVGL